MDPTAIDGVSVILGALAAGSLDGVKEISKSTVTGAADSVKAAYGTLRQLIGVKFKDDPLASAVLAVFEQSPTNEATVSALAERIRHHQLDSNAEVLTAAAAVAESTSVAFNGNQLALSAQVVNLVADRGGVSVVENSGTITTNWGGSIATDGESPNPR